jgi:poly(hydroxyalkanoate) depolymerase family esterase
MTLQSSMAEALRLTRAGKLVEATGLLRKAMHVEPSAAGQMSADDLIELKPRRAAAASGYLPGSPRVTPDGGRFETRRHAGSAGTIDYMLYRPSSFAPGMPLVVMLHGCTQSPEDFARGTGMNRLADELGVLVAYPRQSQKANPQKCWNWFRPGDQTRGSGEPALIAGLTRDIIEAESVDRARVYVAGLSAGGAAAAIMAHAYPDIFAAAGIHSGLACGAAHDLPSALTAMKTGNARGSASAAPAGRFVPVILFHGDRDTTVHEVNARQIAAAAEAATKTALTIEIEHGSADGRRFTRTLSRDGAGRLLIERWSVMGAGHAWSGGDPAGSYADASGPDASRAMLRFFLDHSL